LLGPSCGRLSSFARIAAALPSSGEVVGGAVVGGAVVGGAVVGGAVVGATVVGGLVGGLVGGEVGGAVVGGGGTTVMVTGGTVVVTSGTVVVTSGLVVLVTGAAVVLVDGATVLDGGRVGTATSLWSLELPPSARKATRPMAQITITAPATIRAAVTYCVPLFWPAERRIRSAARAASTNATIVPTTGTRMLTTAQTSAAIAKGSTRAGPPHPPAPPLASAAPVASGSGPTGTLPVSPPFHSSGYCGGSDADISQPYRPRVSNGRLSVGLRFVVTATLPITGDREADALLVNDPLALLIGMLLDQQVPMEWAFRGPATLRERLGGLDCAAIAAMPTEELERVFREKPALHRYPASMAKRAHALCAHIVEQYDGNAATIWKGTRDPKELFARLRTLPGFGEEKAKIFLAILGKRLQVAPKGWEEYARPFSDDEPRSVADIDSAESLLRVRAWKQTQKAKGKSKQD
jgi:uncharacterized HhH-GPD family protein